MAGPVDCTCGARPYYEGASPCHLDYCEVVAVIAPHRYRPEARHDVERNRSYGVRQAIGIPEGRDGEGVARTLRKIENYALDHPEHREIPAGTVCRVHTSNAGFRGIECSALAPDGTRVHGVSLGAFEAVQ